MDGCGCSFAQFVQEGVLFSRMMEVSARFPDRQVFGCSYYMHQVAALGLEPFPYFQSLVQNTSYAVIDRSLVASPCSSFWQVLLEKKTLFPPT